jgi:hypothetical protein
MDGASLQTTGDSPRRAIVAMAGLIAAAMLGYLGWRMVRGPAISWATAGCGLGASALLLAGAARCPEPWLRTRIVRGGLLLLIGLLAGELALRWTMPLFGINLMAVPRHGFRYDRCLAWSRETHHEPLAGCRSVTPARPADGIPAIPLAYNSLGLRGPELGAKRLPRVLLLGDSFMEADELPLEQTAAAVLNRTAGDRFEALQHGAASWSPVTELAWFKRTGDRLGIDEVYLLVGENDFLPASVYPQSDERYRRLYAFDAEGIPLGIPSFDRPASGPMRWLVRSRVLSLALVPAGLVQVTRAGETASGRAEAHLRLRLPPERWDAPLKASTADTLASIGAFDRFARSRGVRFSVMYVPLGIDIDAREHTHGREELGLREGTFFEQSGLEQWLSRTLARSGIRFIGLTEPLRSAKASTDPDGSNVLYFAHDGHWTAAAHEVLAGVVARVVAEPVRSD